MRSAQFDRRLTIERKVVTRDADYGNETISWEAYKDVKARVVESSTAPTRNSGAPDEMDAYARPHKIRIHWFVGFDKATMRLNYGGRILRIMGSAEIDRRTFLEFSCDEWSHEQ